MVTDAFLCFWVGVWIRAQNLHIRFGYNYFPRSYGLSLLRIGACQLWALSFAIEKIGFNFFASRTMGLMGPMGPKRETFVTFGISAMIEISSNIEAAALNSIKK